MAYRVRALTLWLLLLVPPFVLGEKYVATWNSNNGRGCKGSACRMLLAGAESAGEGPTTEQSVPLIPERTRRPDPLRAFKLYKDGYNIMSNHYWASAGWTAVVPLTLALVWLLVGVLSVVLQTCCRCFRSRRWGESAASYSRAEARVWLGAISVLTVLAVIGIILIWRGDAGLHLTAHRALAVITNGAQFVASVIRGTTNILTALADAAASRDINIFEGTNTTLSDTIAAIGRGSNSIDDTIVQNKGHIDSILGTLRMTLIVVGVIVSAISSVGLLMLVLGVRSWCLLVRWIATAAWLVVVAAWILCGIYIMLATILDDTCDAIVAFSASPDSNSAMRYLMPCEDTSAINSTSLFLRSSTHVLANAVNREIASAAATSAQGGNGSSLPLLCNPFSGDPLYQPTTCSPSALSPKLYLKILALPPCNATSASSQLKNATDAESVSCLPLNIISANETAALVQAISAVDSTTLGVQTLEQLATAEGGTKCALASATLSTMESQHCGSLRYFNRLIWVGFLLDAIALTLLAFAWPIYLFRNNHAPKHQDRSQSADNDSPTADLKAAAHGNPATTQPPGPPPSSYDPHKPTMPLKNPLPEPTKRPEPPVPTPTDLASLVLSRSSRNSSSTSSGQTQGSHITHQADPQRGVTGHPSPHVFGHPTYSPSRVPIAIVYYAQPPSPSSSSSRGRESPSSHDSGVYASPVVVASPHIPPSARFVGYAQVPARSASAQVIAPSAPPLVSSYYSGQDVSSPPAGRAPPKRRSAS